MPRASSLPTGAELSILQVLWRRGPSTVRDVHDELASGTSYTTTLKLLQMMHAKSLVRRDDDRRQHVYEAAVDERRTLGALVGEFVDHVFDGSAAAMALRALGDRSATPAELSELKRLIRTLEKGSKG